MSKRWTKPLSRTDADDNWQTHSRVLADFLFQPYDAYDQLPRQRPNHLFNSFEYEPQHAYYPPFRNRQASQKPTNDFLDNETKCYKNLEDLDSPRDIKNRLKAMKIQELAVDKGCAERVVENTKNSNSNLGDLYIQSCQISKKNLESECNTEKIFVEESGSDEQIARTTSPMKRYRVQFQSANSMDYSIELGDSEIQSLNLEELSDKSKDTSDENSQSENSNRFGEKSDEESAEINSYNSCKDNQDESNRMGASPKKKNKVQFQSAYSLEYSIEPGDSENQSLNSEELSDESKDTSDENSQSENSNRFSEKSDEESVEINSYNSCEGNQDESIRMGASPKKKNKVQFQSAYSLEYSIEPGDSQNQSLNSEESSSESEHTFDENPKSENSNLSSKESEVEGVKINTYSSCEDTADILPKNCNEYHVNDKKFKNFIVEFIKEETSYFEPMQITEIFDEKEFDEVLIDRITEKNKNDNEEFAINEINNNCIKEINFKPNENEKRTRNFKEICINKETIDQVLIKNESKISPIAVDNTDEDYTDDFEKDTSRSLTNNKYLNSARDEQLEKNEHKTNRIVRFCFDEINNCSGPNFTQTDTLLKENDSSLLKRSNKINSMCSRQKLLNQNSTPSKNEKIVNNTRAKIGSKIPVKINKSRSNDPFNVIQQKVDNSVKLANNSKENSFHIDVKKNKIFTDQNNYNASSNIESVENNIDIKYFKNRENEDFKNAKEIKAKRLSVSEGIKKVIKYFSIDKKCSIDKSSENFHIQAFKHEKMRPLEAKELHSQRVFSSSTSRSSSPRNPTNQKSITKLKALSVDIHAPQHKKKNVKTILAPMYPTQVVQPKAHPLALRKSSSPIMRNIIDMRKEMPQLDTRLADSWYQGRLKLNILKSRKKANFTLE